MTGDPIITQTTRECLAIAARFTEPKQFKEMTDKYSEPLRLALILRKLALERQAVDLDLLDNVIFRTKIEGLRNSANSIENIISLSEIDPRILENIAAPIYVDDPEFDRLGVSSEKLAFLATQETSLRRSLVTKSLTEIDQQLPSSTRSATS